MAEKAKSMVSQDSQSLICKNVDEFNNRWKYQCNFCREIGVKYLYGTKLYNVPEKELMLMLGACIERNSNPLMVVLAIMRLIYELTVDPFMDRPRHSVRHAWRRLRARLTLMRVLLYFVQGYSKDHDSFVNVVMALLVPKDETPIWDSWKTDQPAFECSESECDTPDDGLQKIQTDSEMEQTEDETPDTQTGEEMEPPRRDVPATHVAPQMLRNVFFMDAPALKKLLKTQSVGLLTTCDIILPGPSLRDIDDAEWAEIARLGLNVRVEYVAPNDLPWLATRMSESGLSKGDYYIVKYAVYFSHLLCNLQVDCATPGVMEFYQSELAKIRMRASLV